MTLNSDSRNVITETRPKEYAAPNLTIGECLYQQKDFVKVDGEWYERFVRNDGWEVILRTFNVPEEYKVRIDENGQLMGELKDG